MRARLAAMAGLAAAGLALTCAGCGQPGGRGPAANCWQIAVRAIEQHVPVRSVPAACAGLTASQLDQVVSSAIRTAAGPHPKAAGRRIAATDGRYLSRLIRAGSTAPLAPATSPGRPAGPDPGLGLAALGCWSATAAAGGWLFAAGGRRRRPAAIAVGHAGAALGGLAVWAAFALRPASDQLAWTAAALVIVAAGLGMAILLALVPGGNAPAGPDLAAAWSAVPSGRPHARRSGGGPRRVLAIACHVTLAVVTMLLVLLAATGAG